MSELEETDKPLEHLNHAARENKDAPAKLTVYFWPCMLILFALALRLPGLEWSLPNAQHPFSTFHPDEAVNLGVARTIDFARGKLDIGYYNYGALFFYLAALSMAIGRGYGLVSPVPSGGQPLSAIAPHMSGLFLAGRIVSLISGILTVALVYAMGNRLYGKKIGLLAGFFMAIAPLAVVHSDFFTVDSTAALFTTLSLLWSMKMQDGVNWKTACITGVWIGLASATKYNMGLAAAAPLMVLWQQRKSGKCLPSMAALALGGIAAFLIGCPGALINFHEFWYGMPGNSQTGLAYELFVHSRTGHGLLFVDTGPGWWYHLVVSLPWGLGLWMELLCLAGLAAAFAKKSEKELPLLVFWLVAFFVTGLSAVRFARYMLPLFPVFCLFGAGISARAGSIGRKVAVVAYAAVSILTLCYTAVLVKSMAGTPVQEQALAYLQKNVPDKGSIAFATVPWFYTPPVSPYFGALSAQVRRQAVAQCVRYVLRIPEKEWSTSVLTPLPNAVVLCNFETMHPVRLGQKRALNFLDRLKGWRVHTFATSLPEIIAPPNLGIVPDDILYVIPSIRVYQPENQS